MIFFNCCDLVVAGAAVVVVTVLELVAVELVRCPRVGVARDLLDDAAASVVLRL